MSQPSIHALFEHEQGYKWEERFTSKSAFKRRLDKLKDATWLHAVDFREGIAVYPSNVYGYLRNM